MSTLSETQAEPPVPPLRRNRDFALLWSGSAVSALGSTASSVAYPLLVLASTGSAADAGLVGFFAMLPMLLVQLPAGALVDQWNRKRMMIWCDLLRGLVVGSVVVALALDELYLTHILIVGFVEGTLSAFHGLAASAAVPNVVHDSQIATALSRNEARDRAATMLGTPLGGALFGLGRAVPFVLDIVSYAVSLTTLLFVKKDLQVRTSRDRHVRWFTEVGEGIAWLWRHAFLRTTALLVAGSNLLFRALFLVVIVMAMDFGASPAAIGIILGVAGVGGVLGSLVSGWVERRLRLNTVVIGANWLWAVLICVIVVADNVYSLAVAGALIWFVGPIWNVAVSTYQLKLTPDRLRGRVLAAASTISWGAIPIGSLGGGFLLDAVGPNKAAAVLAGLMFLLACAATVSRSVRRTTASLTDSDHIRG